MEVKLLVETVLDDADPMTCDDRGVVVRMRV